MDNMTQIMSQIEEGMPVYDSQGNRIGTVDDMHFGQQDAATTQGEHRQRDESLVESLAEALAPNDMPEEVRSRLLHQGFVHIKRGVLASDAYILPEHIARVDDHVHLKVTKENLITR